MTDINSIKLNDVLDDMALKIQQKITKLPAEDVFMVGIHTGGYWVADSLHQRLKLNNDLGSLNISFYRDDYTHIGLHPEVKPSHLPLCVDDKHIILVDDVLYTGRTVRAALNEIFDYGRPASVIFCSLIDRGEHELPICTDIVGLKIQLTRQQQIKLSGPEPLSLSIESTKTEIE